MKALIILALALISGCTNLQSEFYQGKDRASLEASSTHVLLEKNETPQIVRANNMRAAELEAKRKGYSYIGESRFWSERRVGSLSSQAKKLGATLVIYSAEYAGSRVEQREIIIPTTETETTHHNGSFTGDISGSYTGTSTTARQVTNVIPFKKTLHRTNYRFSYWAKKVGGEPISSPDSASEPAYLGILTREGEVLSLKNGVEIITVIGGSPASQAGIQKGDKLISLDNKQITHQADYYAKVEPLRKGRGETEVTVIRNNKAITLQLDL